MVASAIGLMVLAAGGYYASRVIPRALARMNSGGGGVGAAAAQGAGHRMLYRQYEHPFFHDMTREEALLILGFETTSSPANNEVKNKFRQCVKQFHTDVSGSDVVSLKLNQAKEILLK